MTIIAFILIFGSVFLHVTWNFISKSSKPSIAFYALMAGTATICWVPFFIFSDFPFDKLSTVFYWCFTGSVLGEVFYVSGLAYAYRRSDISLVYPMVRALPVIMVAIATMVFGLGKSFSNIALIGMGVITFGCLLMPLKNSSELRISKYKNKVMGFILLGAIGTTMYTVFDSIALTELRDISNGGNAILTLAYLFMIEFGLMVGEVLLLFIIPGEKAEFKRLFLHSWLPVAAGICSSVAYGLVLFSMKFVSNVSYIQAFRQMSLPLGFLAGVILLKEPAGKIKILGLVLITLGLVLASI